MLLEVLFVLPLYIGIFWIFLKFKSIINMTSDIAEFFDEVDTSKEQREYLKSLLEEGKADSLPGKTPWDLKRLNEASDKVINKLYNNVKKVSKKPPKDVMSKMAGVDSVESMMKDINGNFLIRNSATEMMGKLTPTMHLQSNTPMEILGSHVYSKFGAYLGLMSVVCTFWNHLDWETFAAIAAERASTKVEESWGEINEDESPIME